MAESKQSASSFSRIRANTRFVAFLVSVLIATAIWIINALSLPHHHTVSFALLDSGSILAGSPGKGPLKEVQVEISGRGFDLMRISLFNQPPVIDLNRQSAIFRSNAGLRCFDLVSPYFEQFSKSVVIEKITPEWIPFASSTVYLKKVAVKPVYNVNLLPQFAFSGPAVCIPDSILLSSLSPISDSIQFVPVETIFRRNVSQSVFSSANLNLSGLKDISIDTSRVWIYIPVERATECVLKLPIYTEGFASQNLMLIPDYVTLTCNVPISQYEQTTASRFRLTAQIPEGGSKAIVAIKHQPSWVTRVLLEPSTVDFYYKAP